MGSVSIPVEKKDEWDFIEDMPNDYMAEIIRDLDDDWLADIAREYLGRGDRDNFKVTKVIEDAMEKARDNADPDCERWAFNEIDEEYNPY